MRNIDFLAVSITSCNPDDLAGKRVTNVNLNGTPLSTNCRAQAPGVNISCLASGSGCRSTYECLGAAYGDFVNYPITSTRMALDTFYHYYYHDNMTGFFHKYDLSGYFHGLEEEAPHAIDLLLAGNYKFQVLADSSIAVLATPNDSLKSDLSNIVFTVVRDDIGHQ